MVEEIHFGNSALTFVMKRSPSFTLLGKTDNTTLQMRKEAFPSWLTLPPPHPHRAYSLFALHRGFSGHVVSGHEAGQAGAQVVDVEPVRVVVALGHRLHPVPLPEADIGADATLVVVEGSYHARAAAARGRGSAARPRL